MRTTTKNSVIYALYDPRYDNEVRYVGRTVDIDTRMISHIAEATNGYPATAKNLWLKELLEAKEVVTVKVLEKDIPFHLADQAERKWIDYYESQRAKLTNAGVVKRLQYVIIDITEED